MEFNSKLVNDMRSQGDYIIQFILPSLKKYFGKFELVQVEEKLYEPILNQNQNFKGFFLHEFTL